MAQRYNALVAAVLVAVLGVAAVSAYGLSAAPGPTPDATTVAGIDSDGDGLWDDDYALFLYALGSKEAALPATVTRVSGNFVKDWRRHAGLPSWSALSSDQKAYFKARFWNYQETLANAGNASRTLDLAKNLNGWLGCYQNFHISVKQMVGIGPFLQQVMLSRFARARFEAGMKASATIGSLNSELTGQDTVDSCRAMLAALPFRQSAAK